LRPTPGSVTSSALGARHLAAEIVDQLLAQRDDVFRLVAVKPDGLDVVADPVLAERQHLFGRVGHGKQCAGRLVDAGIGGLRGQRDSHHQGEGIDVLEFALGFGPLDLKTAEDLADLLLRIGDPGTAGGGFARRAWPLARAGFFAAGEEASDNLADFGLLGFSIPSL
jgi:hypothetical protein